MIVEECDLLDLARTQQLVAKHAHLDGCIHFAGFKAVGESVSIPLHYYYNNVVGALNLFTALQEASINAMVFSSSCTVYGSSQNVPFNEDEPRHADSPYGNTKVQIEQILEDVGKRNAQFRAAMLRYFNPIGAHPSGRIGEDPKGIPNNLVPYIAQVAIGIREKLSVFGTDYPTPDGTGVRDYIHIMDLAEAHVAALAKVLSDKDMSVRAYNVGSGKGSSVLEVLKSFEKACGKSIPHQMAPRRAGDVASAYCDPKRAREELQFECKLTLDDACKDFWNWQSKNPNGYGPQPSERKAVVFQQLKQLKHHQ